MCLPAQLPDEVLRSLGDSLGEVHLFDAFQDEGVCHHLVAAGERRAVEGHRSGDLGTAKQTCSADDGVGQWPWKRLKQVPGGGPRGPGLRTTGDGGISGDDGG